VRANAETETALLEVLERFCAGFAARHLDGVMLVLAPDPDIVMVTSEESLLRGPEEIRTFLDRYARGSTTYSWSWDRIGVSAAGTIGWLLAEGTETAATQAEQEQHPYRMTMVCEKRGVHWLLLQVHGSSPHTG